jgi:hypothetical protein
MILNTLIRLFGRPKNNYASGLQYTFNCPKCKANNGGVSDGKYNLEVKLSNTKKSFKSSNLWHCWKCEEGGDLFYLVKRWGGRKLSEEYKAYLKEFGLFIPEKEEKYKVTLPQEYIPFSKMDRKNPLHMDALNYLVVVRKIEWSTIIKYQLGFCLTGRYAKRIIIPSYDSEGELNFFTGRDYTQKEGVLKYDNAKCDRANVIFNEWAINWNAPIFLTEGTFEVMAFDCNNIPLLSKVLNDRLLMLLVKYDPPVIVVLNMDAKRGKNDYKNKVDLNFRKKASSTLGICKQLKEAGITNVGYANLPENDLGEIAQKSDKKHIFKIMVNNTTIYHDKEYNSAR